jgi:hypothetical protein
MTMLVIHLIATAFMAGLIVFVQVVHYPLMALVGEGSFVPYEQAHTARTGWVVIPPMMAELASAVWIFASAPSQDVRAMALSGLLLLAVIWTSTAVFQAPAHGRLMRGFDGDVHRWLVRSNWIRTVAWVARVPLAAALVTSAWSS